MEGTSSLRRRKLRPVALRQQDSGSTTRAEAAQLTMKYFTR